jgi:hypothetical protein
MHDQPPILHKHHIIPKHAGGTDDPSNLVELTIEQHAQAHKELYEKYGKIEDRLAWHGLAGLIGKEQIWKEMCGIAKGSKWFYNPSNPSERKMVRSEKDIPDGWIPGRGLNTWAKNRDYTKTNEETVKKQKTSMEMAWKDGKFNNRKICPEKRKRVLNILRERNLGSKREKRQCPHCQQLIAVNAYPRWHGDNCKEKLAPEA